MSEPHVDIRALAALARLEVTNDEIATLEREIPEILSFVETIQSAAGEVGAHGASRLRNVTRDDVDPRESGVYTEAILSNAPARKGNRIAVKQVVSRKKN